MGNKSNQIPNTFLSNSFPIREPKKAMVLCFFIFVGLFLKLRADRQQSLQNLSVCTSRCHQDIFVHIFSKSLKMSFYLPGKSPE